MTPGHAHRSIRGHILLLAVLCLALVGSLGGWAGTTQLSNAVVGEGTVIVDDNVKKIQHLTGGTVTEVLVNEGASVTAGDVLLRLDRTSVEANLAIIDNALAQFVARHSRLQAELSGASGFAVTELEEKGLASPSAAQLVEREVQLFHTRQASLAGIRKQLEERRIQLGNQVEGETTQIKAIQDSITIVDDEYQSVEALYQQNLVTMPRVSGLKSRRAELDGSLGAHLVARAQALGKINEINLQILQLDEDRRAENAKELVEVDAKITEMEARRVEAMEQLRRLDVKAPISGRVYELAVHTVGGVISAGETLMLLSPERRELTIEAKIATRYVDQLAVGQRAEIRFSAFDRATTPDIGGTLTSFSPDVVTDQRTGASYYLARIRPEPDGLARLVGLKLYPGMPAEVFLKLADRSVISYLVKPLTDQLNHVFNEE